MLANAAAAAVIRVSVVGVGCGVCWAGGVVGGWEGGWVSVVWELGEDSSASDKLGESRGEGVGVGADDAA